MGQDMSEAVTEQFARPDIAPGTLVLFREDGSPTAHLTRFKGYGIAAWGSRMNNGPWTAVRVAYTEPPVKDESGVRENQLITVRNEQPLGVAAAFLQDLFSQFATTEMISCRKIRRFAVEGEVSVDVQISQIGSTEDYLWTVAVDGKLVAETQADLLDDQAMERLYDEINSKRRAARCG